MNKKRALNKLEKEMGRVQLPLCAVANLVFGEGDPDALVLFIGEAPGRLEDELGRPFVGRSGQLLDRLIADIGWKREDAYITSVVKRRPPNNRDPLPKEIEAYKPFLARQIEIIEPTVIVTLGRFAMNYFLPDAKITRDQGKLFEVGGQRLYPLFHPAAALRTPTSMKALKAAFKQLPKIVKRYSKTVIKT